MRVAVLARPGRGAQTPGRPVAERRRRCRRASPSDSDSRRWSGSSRGAAGAADGEEARAPSGEEEGPESVVTPIEARKAISSGDSVGTVAGTTVAVCGGVAVAITDPLATVVGLGRDRAGLTSEAVMVWVRVALDWGARETVTVVVTVTTDVAAGNTAPGAVGDAAAVEVAVSVLVCVGFIVTVAVVPPTRLVASELSRESLAGLARVGRRLGRTRTRELTRLIQLESREGRPAGRREEGALSRRPGRLENSSAAGGSRGSCGVPPAAPGSGAPVCLSMSTAAS